MDEGMEEPLDLKLEGDPVVPQALRHWDPLAMEWVMAHWWSDRLGVSVPVGLQLERTSARLAAVDALRTPAPEPEH